MSAPLADANDDDDDDDEIDEEHQNSWFAGCIVTIAVGLLPIVIAKAVFDAIEPHSSVIDDMNPGDGKRIIVTGAAVVIVTGLAVRFACGCFTKAPRPRRRLHTLTVIKPTADARLGVRMESDADDGLTYVQKVSGLFAQAGVRVRDRLVSINDEQVTSATHAASLLANMASDSRIEVQVERGPRRRSAKKQQ